MTTSKQGGLAGFLAAATILLIAENAFAGGITKGPWVQHVTSTSAIVRVEVDPPAAVSVEVGDEHRLVETKEVRALHALTIPNLEPERHYTYTVHVGPMSKVGAFTTAPRDDADTSFRFLIYGDNRTEDAAHAAIVRAMTPVSSDFLLNTGDLVENGASKAQWQTFFEIEAPLLSARPMFSAVGNHELTDGAGVEYARYLGPTELTPAMMNEPRAKNGPLTTRPEELDGTFRWGMARFFLINGVGSYKPGTPDRVWLEKALSDADSEPNLKWRIVAVHHGPFSSGPHGGNSKLHDAGILALLKAHKVDLVVSGHDHIYERGFGSGLPFLVSGGGGAPLYRVKKQIAQSNKAESVRHFIEMAVSPTLMQLAAIRTDGSTIERCSLTHDASGWNCDGNASSSGSGSGGGTIALPDGGFAPAPPDSSPPTKTSRCGCRAVGSDGNDRVTRSQFALFAAFSMTFLAAVLRRRRRPRR